MKALTLSPILLVILCLVPKSLLAQGLIIPGAGPVSRGMAGATTAAPLDAASALYWNPAAISALPQSQMMFGAELAYADIKLGSTFPTGQGGITGGITRSDSGLASIPTIAIVNHCADSRMTMGLGMFAVSGASVNYPGDASNPVLAPMGPLGNVNLGPLFASAAILQISPTVSYQLTDRLAVGLGGMVDYTTISLDPAFFATPDDANGDGVVTFPPGTHARPYWGGGFQFGLFYELNENWDLGFSFKSPQWLETWRFNSKDEVGNARDIGVLATLPMIYSWGAAYKGIERTIISTDFRFVDYRNTDLFGEAPINGGVGWKSVFAAAVGAQRQITDSMTLRAGYLYSENPIPAPATLFNMQLPAITEHTLSAGATLQLNDSLSMSVAYVHAFHNTIRGSILQIPGADVAFSTKVNSLVIGMSIDYGACSWRSRRCECCECGCQDCCGCGEAACGR